MTVTETNKGYEVAFAYDPRKVADVKKIPGTHYIPNLKSWYVPKNHHGLLVQFANKYGGIKKTDTRLSDYDHLPAMPEPSEKLIEFVGNNIKLQPYGYQMQGIQRGGQLERFINGDEPGLGKTLQSIVTVTALNAFPCLIVCPSTLKENWRREWSVKFTNKKSAIMVDSVRHSWPAYLDAGVDVFIVNYESLKKYFVKSINTPKGQKLDMRHISFRPEVAKFRSLVFDEIHKLKDPSTQQSKFAEGISRGKKVVIGLTGTPIVNKPKDLVQQLKIIGRLDDFGGYRPFVDRYCDGGNGSSNLKELHYRMHHICFFRRNKKEVLHDLPDRVRQVVICEISTRKEYEAARDGFVEYLKSIKDCSQEEIEKKLRAQYMVQMGVLKGISAKGKLESVYQWADEIIESGEKVILFCDLHEIGDAVVKHYGNICVAVRGDMSEGARQRSIDQFQENPDVRVIVVSIKAGSTGLTLTASSRVGFIEFPWTDAVCDQCESRPHRIGQKESVQCVYFLGENTVDNYCYDIIKTKRSISQIVVGQSEIEENVIDGLINLLNQG